MLPDSASFLVTEDCNLACKYCVAGDTKILTDDFKEVEIKDINIGDKILGFDEYSNGENKYRKIKPAKVLQTFVREDNVIRITLENGQYLDVTEGHPLLTSKGEWKSAGEFKYNQELVIIDNGKLINNKIIDIKSLNKKTVYNLETTSNTYFANNFAVHNCFELKKRNKSAMSIEVIHKSLDMLCEGAKQRKSKQFHAMIFGGEPLLRPDLIKELCDYGLKLQQQSGIKFTAGIITNATVMNDEIFWLLTEYKDKVNMNCQLSIDGIKKVQDMYRVTRSGKGSFDMIEKNIPKFKLIYRNNPNMLNIHGCVNKQSLPYLFESYKFFKEEWGIPRIWFMPVHEESWEVSDIEIYKAELNKITDYILTEVKETKSTKPISMYAPIDRCLRPDVRHTTPCGAGRSYVGITAKGDIYSCHHFYFNDPENTKIGDVFNGIDEAKKLMYEKYDNSDMSCPSDCEHSHCYRCIAANYEQNGSIFSQIRGIYCKMQKVDREVQLKVRKELENMGLFNTQNSQPKLRREDMKDAKFIEAWVENGIYYERYKNPDDSETILDRPARIDDVNISIGNRCNPDKRCNDKQKCENNSEISKQIDLLAFTLKNVIERLDRLESKE